MNSLFRRLRSPRVVALVAAFALIPLLFSLFGGDVARATSPMPPNGLPAHKGGVHGSVWAAGPLAPNGQPEHFAVVGHMMQLRDKVTNALVAQTATDVFGRFYFPPQPLGTYRLKWISQAGWQAGTYPHDVIIDQGTVSVEWIQLRPLKRHTVFVGTVRLRDGSVPGIVDEFFALDRTPEVSVVSGTGTPIAGPVRSDANARYAISANLSGTARLRARIDSVSTQANVGANFGGPVVQNLVLPNSSPDVVELYLRGAGGRGVRGGMAGDVLTSVDDVIDPDGDAVSIQWKSEYVSGEPYLTRSGNQVTWQLPDASGGYNLYAVISDGRGAYVRRSVAATINKTRELFTGTVLERGSGNPIAGASVEVNGEFATTAANGYYAVEVPIADRYVLNIRSADYALAGRAFDTGSLGRVWRLPRRQREVFDPKVGATLIDRRAELNGRRGATLTLPPDVLVDPQGNPATGPLTASFATIDIGADESASNYAAEQNGRLTGLMSYGVLSIEITDAQGREYQIRQGGRAELTMPIPGVAPGELPAGAPNTIAVWSYDEADGLWKQSGDAVLDRQNSTYVGTVNHFSEINVDAPGSDSAIRVLVDPHLIDAGAYLRVSDVAGNGLDYAAVVEGAIDQPLSVIYTIPPGQLVRIEVLDGPGGIVVPGVEIERFDSGNPSLGWILLPGDEVLAGPVCSPTFPAYPYSECPVTITLKKTGAPTSSAFLTNKGLGNLGDATDYYIQADLPLARATLQDWWAHNGFDPDGSVVPVLPELYARTSYVNDNDLGSGRDMHLFRRDDGTVAAWVSNYGKFNQAHGNADLAFNQNNLGNIVATVCMESAPMENVAGEYIDSAGTPILPANFGTLGDYHAAVEAASVVKFFVFADADANPGDELQPSADLDGYGAKFVPNLCLNCHGGSANGTYNSPDDCYVNAYLRELDYHTYKFPGGALAPSVAEQQAFRTQNDIVRSTNTSFTSNDAIKELIDIWYNDGPGDVDQDDSFDIFPGVVDTTTIPVDWFAAGNPIYHRFYADVIGRSCRTCHIAFDGFSFNDSSIFQDGNFMEFAIDDFINNTPGSGTMPHAIITYRNFWLSSNPHRPDAAQFFIDNN